MGSDICRCSCGHIEFHVKEQPLIRIYCHCNICQSFNKADFADVLIYDNKAITEPAEGMVAYKSYKDKSPILRGKCPHCDNPILEKTISGGKFWIIPRSAFKDKDDFPTPVAHMFYETRRADIDDDIAKYKSGIFGNLMVARHVILAKLFKNKRG